ncbi:hypothetical protein DOY81_004187 [Sarcophaga bullata]|nr:hypothetical protein DOY81_004187 [Sarcophaga bullata]
MKIFCLVMFCVLATAMALPQYKIDRTMLMPPVQDSSRYLPRITGTAGGTGKQFNIDLNAQQRIWQSQNQRHSIHATGGYTRSFGVPDAPKPDLRLGAGYTFRFKG